MGQWAIAHATPPKSSTSRNGWGAMTGARLWSSTHPKTVLPAAKPTTKLSQNMVPPRRHISERLPPKGDTRIAHCSSTNRPSGEDLQKTSQRLDKMVWICRSTCQQPHQMSLRLQLCTDVIRPCPGQNPRLQDAKPDEFASSLSWSYDSP